jgi:hypothetical protein
MRANRSTVLPAGAPGWTAGWRGCIPRLHTSCLHFHRSLSIAFVFKDKKEDEDRDEKRGYIWLKGERWAVVLERARAYRPALSGAHSSNKLIDPTQKHDPAILSPYYSYISILRAKMTSVYQITPTLLLNKLRWQVFLFFIFRLHYALKPSIIWQLCWALSEVGLQVYLID